MKIKNKWDIKVGGFAICLGIVMLLTGEDTLSLILGVLNLGVGWILLMEGLE